MDAIEEDRLNYDEDVEVPNASSKKSSRGSNYFVDECEMVRSGQPTGVLIPVV
jgi:hypothetical protein